MANRAFLLTKSHVLSAFKPLSSPDPAIRAKFMNETLQPDVNWTITGSAHALAGTRTSARAHNEASFARLGALLTGPIIFTVLRVLVDNGEDQVVQDSQSGVERKQEQWAAVEMKGEAMVKASSVVVDGVEREHLPEWKYENEYCMLTRWDGEGKIVEVRSWHDTALAEKVLESEKHQ